MESLGPAPPGALGRVRLARKGSRKGLGSDPMASYESVTEFKATGNLAPTSVSAKAVPSPHWVCV